MGGFQFNWQIAVKHDKTKLSTLPNIGEIYLNFLFQHELQSIIKEPACFKNAHIPSCIDFILTNSSGR